MEQCDHISETDDHKQLVELCILDEAPGKLLFGLKCVTCQKVLDTRWFPDQLRCVLVRGSLH